MHKLVVNLCWAQNSNRLAVLYCFSQRE
jgi:hypothetical protein